MICMFPLIKLLKRIASEVIKRWIEMYKDLISVIVAVYNVEKYLDKCIESIVKQTYKKLEIILVDDGSTDSSYRICDKWGKRDSRIHVIHKKNGGVSEARNFGIQASHGKWICFVDGDDYVDITMYENLFTNRVNGGISVCGYYLVNGNSKYACVPPNLELNSRQAAELYIDNELSALENGTFTYLGAYAWNKIYDRNLFNNISYPIGKKFEDVFIILSLLKNAKKIKIISYCGYYYIQRVNSISHSFETIQTDSLEARKKQKQEFLQYWGITDRRIDRLIGIEYFSIMRQYTLLSKAKKKDFYELRKNAWYALRKIGYGDFSIRMKIKLVLCLMAPHLYQYIFYRFKMRKYDMTN